MLSKFCFMIIIIRRVIYLLIFLFMLNLSYFFIELDMDRIN